MRRLFTVREASARGVTRAQLRWALKTGKVSLIERGVYLVGQDPTPPECAVGAVLATRGVASLTLAASLLKLDSIVLRQPFVTVPPTGNGRRSEVRRSCLPSERIIVVEGIRCTDGLQTLLDLAPLVSDVTWQQVLESALRKRLTTIAALEAALAQPRQVGASRIRRVLGLRPPNAPSTDSLLETLMVQLAREVPDVPAPDRQVLITNLHGGFVARVDLAWPDLGLFTELDGQHHKDQPVYDASRETAVVAATGWLCGRFTWAEVVYHRHHTIRRLVDLVDQARRRPLPAKRR